MQIPQARWLPFSLLLLAVFAYPATSRAQNREGESKKLVTQTGFEIYITYFESPGGKESPVVVLLHDADLRGNRKKWDPAARALQARGCAVVTVDLRKHGESKDALAQAEAAATGSSREEKLKPLDYQLMVQDDLEAVKAFLLGEHQDQKLNIRKSVIAGIGASAVVALNYSLLDWNKKPYPDAPTLAARTPRGQDIRGIVLISPESSLPRMQTTQPLQALSNPAAGIAFLVMAGVKKAENKKSADKIFRRLESAARREKEQRMFYQEFPTPLNGEDLIASPRFNDPVTKTLVKFVDDHIKPLDMPWRDRKSRL